MIRLQAVTDRHVPATVHEFHFVKPSALWHRRRFEALMALCQGEEEPRQ